MFAPSTAKMPISFIIFITNENSSKPLTAVCLPIVNQEPEELFETVSQALLSSVDRDCLSGWGGHVFVV